MKTKARGGLRPRRIKSDGGTLGAYRQITYLVRMPAPRRGSLRSVGGMKFFYRVRCVRVVMCICVVFFQFFFYEGRFGDACALNSTSTPR